MKPTIKNFNLSYVSYECYTASGQNSKFFECKELAPLPIKKGTLKIKINNVIIATVDENNKFHSSSFIFDKKLSKVKDITKGHLYLHFTDIVSSEDDIDIEWEWDSGIENNFDEYGTIEITTKLTSEGPKLVRITRDSDGNITEEKDVEGF